MSVRYKAQKTTLKDPKYNGKYYGRAVSLGHVTTEQLAEEISHSTTVTKADIFAVLTELSHFIKEHLQNSMSVDLAGIGSFRVGLKSSLANDEKSFTANNIKRFQIVYSPEVKFVANGKVGEGGRRLGTYVKSLLDGITAEPLVKSKKSDSSTTAPTEPTTTPTTTPTTEPTTEP